MNALRAGVLLGWSRARGPGLPFALAAGVALAVALARVTRARTSLGALDELLEGPILGWLLPVVAYLVAQRVTGDQGLEQSVQPLARHGADRRQAACGLLLVAAGASALIGGSLAAVTVSASHARWDGPWLSEVAATTLIAAAAGAVYAAWFWAASTLGRRGGGRAWALALDFLLGAGSSTLALPFPRSHLRNLLGGEPPLDLSQRAAWGMLALLLAGSSFVALRRLAR